MEIRASPTEDLGFYDRDLFPVQMEQDGPRLKVPDAPGLGVEFNEELAASARVPSRSARATCAAATARSRIGDAPAARPPAPEAAADGLPAAVHDADGQPADAPSRRLAAGLRPPHLQGPQVRQELPDPAQRLPQGRDVRDRVDVRLRRAVGQERAGGGRGGVALAAPHDPAGRSEAGDRPEGPPRAVAGAALPAPDARQRVRHDGGPTESAVTTYLRVVGARPAASRYSRHPHR